MTGGTGQSGGKNLSVPDARSDDRRRLDVLALIAQAGGAIRPVRNPAARGGHDFGVLGDAAVADLKYLAQRDYLEERYFDRISICPKCSSHHLNVREVCPSCRSTHYSEEPLLHHFRCGYVGRITEFAAADGSGKRICPKCATQLKYLGTDHDQLGRTFLCIDCGTSFQEAPVSGVCLECETETAADRFASLQISSYSLTSLGAAAVRRGNLFEQDSEVLFISGASVYRPSVMREMLHFEARRSRRFKSAYSLLIVQSRSQDDPDQSDDLEGQMLRALRDRLRGSDALGQLADHLFAVCMPQTPLKGAQNVLNLTRQIAPPGLAVETSLVEIGEPEHLQKVLATYRLG